VLAPRRFVMALGPFLIMNQSVPSSLLIVDDEEAVRDALSRRLERKGFRVTACPNGRRALELLGERQFDLVLLDVVMSGLDGFQVLEALRSRYNIAELPVIMATAKHDSEDVVRALELGANDFVSKPIDFPVALARIQNQLALRRSNAQAVAVFRAVLVRCLEHFFPDATLEPEDDSSPVAWQGEGRTSFRLGEPGAGPGVDEFGRSCGDSPRTFRAVDVPRTACRPNLFRVSAFDNPTANREPLPGLEDGLGRTGTTRPPACSRGTGT